MKHIFAVLLVFSLIAIFSIESLSVSYTLSRKTTGGNGVWWNPFDTGYSTVNTDADASTGKKTIVCYGDGRLQCPKNLKNDGTPIYSIATGSGEVETDLLSNMVDYIFNQALNGNLSGNAQFYTTINGINYLTTGTWVSDSTQSDVNVLVTTY